MRDYSDDELAALVKDGSAEAFDLIIDRYYRMVFNYLLRLLANKEDAEDALQDVFFRAAGAMAKYRMEGKLKSWIFTIANNAAITKIRQRKRRRVVRGFMFGHAGGEEENPVDLIADESFEPAKTAANNEIRRLLEAAVDSLSFDQKQVFTLRHFSGLSFKEISKVLGVPLNTALGRMYYANKKLKKILGDELL